MAAKHKRRGNDYRKRARKFARSGERAAPVQWLVAKDKHTAPSPEEYPEVFGVTGMAGALAIDMIMRKK